MKPSTLALGPAVLIPLIPARLFAEGEPSDLRFATPFLPGTTIELTWVDNCDDEEGFEVQYLNDGVWTTFFESKPNDTLLPINAGEAGSMFEFRVRAMRAEGNSAWTDPIITTNPADIAIRNRAFAGGTVGEQLVGPTPSVFTNPADAGAASFSVRDLPNGLEFDTATGIISGTPLEAGLFRPIVSAHHPDGVNSASTFITLRIKSAPSGPLQRLALPSIISLSPPALPLNLALDDHFYDPDTSTAVRISTTLGDIDTILHPEACPATIENFFNYVDGDAYRDVIFHRSAVTATSGVEVIQAGLMKPDGDGNYTRVVTDPNVIDEPGLSNLTGTIAMAKTSARDSGSSQWYFNTIDNTNLDGPQSNGGYTVFGRATSESLPVIAGIQSRPRGDYSAIIDGSELTLNDWPTTVLPAGPVPALDELIQIQSITRLDALSYEIGSNSNPDLLTAMLTGSALTLTPLPGMNGVADLTIEVTDLDGATISARMSYCILELDLSPGISPDGKLAGTFNHEKGAAGLSYQLQRSLDGQTWNPVWSTSDGIAAPAVIANEDLGSRWRLTVEDNSINARETKSALLRIVVTK